MQAGKEPELHNDELLEPADWLATDNWQWHQNPIKGTADALNEKGVTGWVAIVGTDFLSCKYIDWLREWCPGIEWCPEDDLVKSVQHVKSPRELDVFREAGEISTRALNLIMGDLLVGKTEAEAGMRGAPAGDLYIFISTKPHKLFQREGANIFCTVPLAMTTAALGGSVQVPTIDAGRAKVTIPSGTQSARQFRLRGKGMTGLHGRGRGDMYIEIVVETPVNLTKRQQELLKEFEQGGGTGAKATSPQAEGFFSKVKELWDDLTE